MLVLFESSLQGEFFLVIPNFDFGVIWAADKVGLSRMDKEGPNKIGVRLEGLQLLSGVIVKYSYVKVIWPADYPMLLGDELDCSDWESRRFQGFYWSLHMRGATFVE
jgi:hypothetical protein